MEEGQPQEMRHVKFVYTLWWPIRLALWFVGGLSDVRLCVGMSSHPEKPIMITLSDDRDISRGFGCVAWNIATARQWARHLLSVCDQYEAFYQMVKDVPVPELAKGKDG